MNDIPPLHRRQREALAHLALGLSAKEIGRRMGIDYRTVESHLCKVRKFFGLPRGERALTAWAVRHERELRSEANGHDHNRADLLSHACRDFRMRLQFITGDPHWRHPNLAAAADRLRKLEEDLLLWSRNQRLADETPREEAADAEETL